MKLNRIALLFALTVAMVAGPVHANSGSGAVVAMKNGDFKVRYFNGTQAGVDSAVTYCSPGGIVTLGPGMEAINPTGPIPTSVLVQRNGNTGWNLQGNSATTIVPRLGPASTTTTGGAFRIVDGVTFPLTVAGVQAALNECGAAGGGTTYVPASANIQVSTVGVKIPNRVNLFGIGTRNDSLFTFACTATCNVGAVIENAKIDGTQGYVGIANINIAGNQGAGASDSFGIRLRSVFIGSFIQNVLVTAMKSPGGAGIRLDDPGAKGFGPIRMDNVTVADTSGDGISIGNSVTDIVGQPWMTGINVERWGVGKAAIRFRGNCTVSASFGGILHGAYFEANTDATGDGVVVSGYSMLNIENLMFNGGLLNYPVKIEGATGAICQTYGIAVKSVYAPWDTLLFDQGNNFAITNANGNAFANYHTPSKTPSYMPNLVAPDSLRVMQLLQFGPTSFAGLGTPANGVFRYCSDCTKATPCAGSGTGALAKRINGAWDCN